jgi:hypothetical protein
MTVAVDGFALLPAFVSAAEQDELRRVGRVSPRRHSRSNQ